MGNENAKNRSFYELPCWKSRYFSALKLWMKRHTEVKADSRQLMINWRPRAFAHILPRSMIKRTFFAAKKTQAHTYTHTSKSQRMGFNQIYQSAVENAVDIGRNVHLTMNTFSFKRAHIHKRSHLQRPPNVSAFVITVEMLLPNGLLCRHFHFWTSDWHISECQIWHVGSDHKCVSLFHSRAHS